MASTIWVHVYHPLCPYLWSCGAELLVSLAVHDHDWKEAHGKPSRTLGLTNFVEASRSDLDSLMMLSSLQL